MRLRKFLGAAACAAVLGGFALPAGTPARAQQPAASATRRGEGTPAQRITVMRSRLEALRRSLNSAIATLNVGGEKKEQPKPTDDAAGRLRGIEREVGQLLSEVNDLGSRIDRADKFDPADLDKLEPAVAELNERGEKTLTETAGERRTAAASAPADKKDKKKKGGGGGFLGLGKLFGGGDDEDKYAELLSGAQVGYDRRLFEEAAKLTRKSNYEGARLLFSTVITTYPDSPYLPHAKLAIADTFYLEGTTGALIQAGNAYQEWLTFFPTDPLADEVMLKVAEVEMRQMGLPDRDVTHARRAEQRLKALLQQFPQTALRPEVEIRIREVQENLGMHSFSIGNFYLDRYLRQVAPNPKGAQSRYLETLKYPHFSRIDKALYLLATTYVYEEEPDEAVKYFQRILREHPNSEFAERAREQLDAIGAEKPEADPKAMNKVPPPDRGMMRRFLDQLIGTTPKTIDNDGVLIRKDSKEPALIDVIIENKGNLPVTTPTAPVSSRRIAPARPVVQPQPQPKPQQQPATPPQRPATQPNTTQPQQTVVDGAKPPTAQPTATPPPPPGR